MNNNDKKFVIFCDERTHPNLRNTSLNFGREIFARLTNMSHVLEDVELDDCRIILVESSDMMHSGIFAKEHGLEEKYNIVYSWDIEFLKDFAKSLRQIFDFEANPHKFERFPNGIPGEE